MENVKWKVIYTSSRQEKKVAAFLEKMKVEHYLPLYKSLRFWKDRKKWVEFPLFNGYLFVKPSDNERDLLLQIPGVVRYIRYNAQDAEIPENQIFLIKEFVKFGYNLSNLETTEKLELGDKAEVLDGPLKGQTVEVFIVGDDSYIIVTFEALNQSIKVSLPKEILKITEKHSAGETVKSLW
jgi:transcription antitermination factor NusG